MTRDLTGVILAGGESVRMGRDKACLTLGGSTFLALIAETLGGVVGKVVISARESSDYRDSGLPVIPDIHPGCGPLGGIHAGLTHVPTDGILVVSCDMPLVTGEICDRLLSARPPNDAVIARWGGRLHPMFGVYRKGILPVLERRLGEAQYSVLDCIDELTVTVVDMPDSAFVPNINTPEDYGRLLTTLAERPVHADDPNPRTLS